MKKPTSGRKGGTPLRAERLAAFRWERKQGGLVEGYVIGWPGGAVFFCSRRDGLENETIQDVPVACALLLGRSMNPPASSTDRSDTTFPDVLPRVIVPVPPEREGFPPPSATDAIPACHRRGDELLLLHGAPLPTERCIRCNRQVATVRNYTLRDRRNFRTWFSRGPDLAVGLCRKHEEEHAIAVALTWSVLAVGAMLLMVGVLTSGFLMVACGFLAVACSGFFRAGSPVGSPEASENRIVVSGACANYLRGIPEQFGADDAEERDGRVVGQR